MPLLVLLLGHYSLFLATGYAARKRNRIVFGWMLLAAFFPLVPFLVVKFSRQKQPREPEWGLFLLWANRLGVIAITVYLTVMMSYSVYRGVVNPLNDESGPVATRQGTMRGGLTDSGEDKGSSKLYRMLKENEQKNIIEPAKQGDPEAQFKLGKLYFTGRKSKAKPDYDNALIWFKKAADQGHTESQVALGMMYLDGLGVEKDAAKALAVLKSAADKGHHIAHYYLGRIYEDKGEYESAVESYLASAGERYGPAIYRLALIKRKGLGVPPSDKRALNLILEAAKQGSAQAQFELGVMYQEGKEVERNMEEAVSWYKKASERRDARLRSYLNIVSGLAGGEDVDPTEDMDIHEKHIAGHAQAQYNLGLIYRDGIGVNQSYGKADKWFVKAAAQGHAPAQYELGMIRLEGLAYRPDPENAFYWLKKAAEQGHKGARYQLDKGYYYLNAPGPGSRPGSGRPITTIPGDGLGWAALSNE